MPPTPPRLGFDYLAVILARLLRRLGRDAEAGALPGQGAAAVTPPG
ncbi:hypothetical protein [Streptomyces sp. NPDC017941]